MFSTQGGMPGQPNISQEKKGPNVGYRPYWYAYNFQTGWMGKQKEPYESSHEDWDYGLGGGSGKGLWGGGKHSMMLQAGDAPLGTGDLVDQDIQPEDQKNKHCDDNLGKSCRLGPPPWNYNAEEIDTMWRRTLACDKCSYASQQVGTVCTVDRTGTVFQDMDQCIMDKMNCLGGTAYIYSWEWNYWKKFQKYPFLMQPQWVRVSFKGTQDVDIKLFSKFPYTEAQYWIVVYGWPYTGPTSGIFTDCAEPYVKEVVWLRRGGYAVNKWNYTEYSIVWNPKNGWFLMSQPRYKNWPSLFQIEYVDPTPRDFKYIDVATGWSGNTMEIILQDLTVLHPGTCEYKATQDDFPSDSDEVFNRSRAIEKAYNTRYKLLEEYGYRPQDWDAEDASYIEY